MAWKTPGGDGGGPWSGGGGGGRNPWGRGPSGPSGQPPDFERLWRQARDRFDHFIYGRMGPGRTVGIIALVAIVLWALTGIYTVTPNEVGVVQRFGRFVEITQPGLNYHLPYPIETAATPDVTHINEIDLGVSSPAGLGQPTATTSESLMLTGDQNIVDINFSVFWRIRDPAAFLFNVRDPRNMVRVVAESAMREVVGQLPIVAALSEDKQSIIDRTLDRMQELLDSYHAGITVTRVALGKVDPPAEVIDAFNDVQRAKADQERLANEAQAYQNSVVPAAQGDAQRLIQEADGYKQQVIDLAEGDSQRFISVLTAYRTAPEVTARRLYLDMMENVLKSTQKVIVDPDLHGVVPYLPLPGLQPAPAPATNAAPQASQPAAPPASAPGPSASLSSGLSSFPGLSAPVAAATGGQP